MASQAWCSTPCNSPTIVGMAVETIIWSSEDRNIPAMRAEKMTQIVRWVSTTTGPAGSGGPPAAA
ncbi:hypothetical protein GCM10025864_37580 [Luteimicrobium album]|uniref:Uncharacterized protein n=1 Tax=Luteimicrobium album TaxID=1054550 RepID=A0ABQ6I8E1_9MICO|nr:hypothetical protein GCM10025864_37580 [Luteimicrobium album]